MQRVILVRHGESEGNRSKTFTDTSAVPLTEMGRRQAKRAAEWIAERYQPLRVVSSPYARARSTAEIIAARLHLDVVLDSIWREQDLGRFAGRPYASVLEDPEFSAERRWQWKPQGGESLIEVQQRIAPAFHEIFDGSPEPGIIVVSHAGVMQAVRALLAGGWEAAGAPGNTGIFVVERRAGGATTLDAYDVAGGNLPAFSR